MGSFKSNLLALFLFVLITFPAYSALLHPGMLTSHDGEGHIIRMFEFNNALADGHFPVRWAKRLNWGLGYPFFNFNYPLIYYLTYVMSKLGFDLLTAFKTILLLSFPFSGFFVFLWLKQHFVKTAAFAGGLFYTLIPYHFVNVYVRGNLGETLALTIIPLNFYLINYLNQKPNLNRAILLNFGLSFLILTHNLSALLFLPVILVYGLLLSLQKKYLKYLICAFIFPLLVTCFFWLPAAYDKQFITIDKTFPLYYLKHFPDLKDLIYSPWGFGGSKVGPGQMSVQIGLLHLMIFGGSVVALIIARLHLASCNLKQVIISFKKFKQKKMTIFFFGLSILAFFMMLPVSKPVWDAIKPMQYLQFPWRLLSVVAVAVSFLASFVLSVILKIIPKKFSLLLLIIFILGLLFVNRNHWKANEYYQLPDYWFQDRSYNSTTTVDGEHTPKWQKEDMPNETARFELISGTAGIKSLEWKTNYHTFQADVKSKIIMLDRTVYFPGWTVFMDGKRIDTLSPYDPKGKGLIGFLVPTGQHLIEVKLLEPDLNKAADMISLLSIILLLGLVVYSNRSFWRHNI